MKVVSLYTPNYEPYAARLQRSLAKHGIENYVLADLPEMSWFEAIHCKAGFIWDVLRESEEPVLWLDADAEVVQHLDLLEGDLIFGEEADFAVFRRDYPSNVFRSGTIWFGPTPAAIALAAEWLRRTALHRYDAGGRNDQQLLFDAWGAAPDDLRTKWLPIGYCQKTDEREDDPSCGVPPDPHPTILHHQASRTHR